MAFIQTTDPIKCNDKNVHTIVGVFMSVVLENHNNNTKMVSALLFSSLPILKVNKLILEKKVGCCVLKEQGLNLVDK